MLHRAYYITSPRAVVVDPRLPLTSANMPQDLLAVPAGTYRPVRIGQDQSASWWSDNAFWQSLAQSSAQMANVFNVVGGGQPTPTYPYAARTPYGYPVVSAPVPGWVWLAGAGGLGLVLVLMLSGGGKRR
jgi:hypothetical protein